eukprot:889759-Prymnesium_polylepis.1
MGTRSAWGAVAGECLHDELWSPPADYGGPPIWEMAGYPFERALAAGGVTRWVDLVRVRQGYIAWLGLWEDFYRYGIEQQQRPRWAQR